MTEEKLNALARDLYAKHFGREFKGEVVLSRKMRVSAGNCRPDGRIALNLPYCEKYGEDEAVRVLKHELAHLFLFQTVGNHSHKDRVFNEILDRIDGAKVAKPMPAIIFVYACPKCHKEWRFARKDNRARSCNECSLKKGDYCKEAKIELLRTTLWVPGTELPA